MSYWNYLLVCSHTSITEQVFSHLKLSFWNMHLYSSVSYWVIWTNTPSGSWDSNAKTCSSAKLIALPVTVELNEHSFHTVWVARLGKSVCNNVRGALGSAAVRQTVGPGFEHQHALKYHLSKSGWNFIHAWIRTQNLRFVEQLYCCSTVLPSDAVTLSSCLITVMHTYPNKIDLKGVPYLTISFTFASSLVPIARKKSSIIKSPHFRLLVYKRARRNIQIQNHVLLVHNWTN